MPSLDQLRATLAGMLKQPATRIASVLQAPGGAVARVIWPLMRTRATQPKRALREAHSTVRTETKLKKSELKWLISPNS